MIERDGRKYSVYEPVGSALALFKNRDRVVGFDGPTRTGKSRACIEKIHACLLKYDGARALFVRQTMRSLRNTALQTYEDDVLGHGHPLRAGASRDGRVSYKYDNGSEIAIAGLDDISKILSGEYDMIFVQQMEECDFDDVQTLTTRLSGKAMPYRQLLFDCNPGAPTHWIKDKEESGWLTLLHSKHEENPLLYDRKACEWTEFGAEYIAGLDQLSGFVKERLRHGLWVSAEGARWSIYPEEHIFRMNEKWPYGVPAGQRILIGMDWGSHAPFAAVWIAIDTEKNAWVFREAYQPGLTADQQAERVVELTGGNERIHAIYPDPTVFNTNSGGNKTIASYYQDIFARDPRFGPVLEGDRTLNRRKQGMATIDAMIGRNNGFPNLYIEASCVNLIKELNEAKWWQPKHGVAKEDIDPSCADHAITGLYYALNQWYTAPVDPAPVLSFDEIRENAAKVIYERELRNFERAHSGRTRIRI